MQRDVKMSKLSQSAYTQQAVEILAALRKLGEKVSGGVYLWYLYICTNQSVNLTCQSSPVHSLPISYDFCLFIFVEKAHNPMHGCTCPQSLESVLSLQLSPMEIEFLTSHSSAALSQFESVSTETGASEKVLKMAGSQVESARK